MLAVVNASAGSRRNNLSWRLRGKRWPERSKGQAGAAFVLISAALCGCAPVADASTSNVQATHTYLIARYSRATALLHNAGAVLGADRAAATEIARECAGVVSGMPQELSEKRSSVIPPRARGENARLLRQKQTIEEELVGAIVHPGYSLYRQTDEAYAAKVRDLSWSNPAIASALQASTTTMLEVISAPVPPFCADARAWAQSGYRALSAASREFEASQAARRNSGHGTEHFPGTLLKPYEDTSDRKLVRKTNAVENKLHAKADAFVSVVIRSDRIVGFPQIADEPKQINLGHGRTSAGTRFDVTSKPGPLGLASCHRSATVAYSQPGAPAVLVVGGPNNPICLSRPRYRHPALFCEAGIESIQTAVPASVRLVRLVLADGRTIKSRVIRIPRRDGGPAGIYAQEIRGSMSRAVSLVELNAGGSVVLTVKLPLYRCVKRHTEPEGLPTPTKLASGQTPEGEAFTISAFGSFDNGAAISVNTGADPQINEITIGAQAPKAFPWSLSIGCAPHPYAILYGVLAPPGKSVVAQTPQGAISLNVIPIQPRLHARGPLVYGVFSALPSELTVLGVNDSTVYTENLEAKASEAAQFCEGYAEP